MGDVTIRDLRNRGGDIVDRAATGERVTITRDGTPVAELRPLPRPPLDAAAVLAGARLLPTVDPAALRTDVDGVVDPAL